jgi:diadenosine tetraphosphate (Ap4A) HIT family hydrolase
VDFALHARLAADCFVIGDLPLCRVLLNNDARFPWCILVPRLTDLRDFHDVPPAHRGALFDEIERVSIALLRLGQADKMNVAALGNMVPQLHIHVIARRTDDPAWPAPVWSAGAGTPYADPEPLIAQLKARLDLA